MLLFRADFRGAKNVSCGPPLIDDVLGGHRATCGFRRRGYWEISSLDDGAPTVHANQSPISFTGVSPVTGEVHI
jgi:hypothetical protein